MATGSAGGRGRRVRAAWRRRPLRIRLVAGFAVAMLVVLAGAGTFVYIRVQIALDQRLNADLTAQAAQLTALARRGALSSEHAVDTLVTGGVLYQILDPTGRVLLHGDGLTGIPLLDPYEVTRALRAPLRTDRGTLLPISTQPLRIDAVPVQARPPAAGQPAIVVVAVRRDHRDEALRELIGQLTLANLAALAVASLVGYRLTRAALDPVERYRARAAQIAAGATGLRLSVGDNSDDEISRLGHTLNDMLAALDTALASERRFVHDASHELRTPLTLLSTELELALRRPRTAAELEHTVRAAIADTADLIALTDTLLTVGVAGPASAPLTPVDLTTLVTAIVNRYRATTADHVIHLHTDDAVTVAGDPVRLTRAVSNLLDNAVRHGRGPVTVAVSAAGPFAAVCVHDHGDGIDPGFLALATGRFTRADTARTSPGTGLGLAVVEAVVRGHRGELRLCSRDVHHHPVDAALDHRCQHPAVGTAATILLIRHTA